RHAALLLTRLKLSKEEVRRTVRGLSDSDSDVRHYLVKTLAAHMASVEPSAVPNLVALLNYPPQYSADACVEAKRLLRRLGPGAADALIAVAEDTKQAADFRASTAEALGEWLEEPRVAAALRRLLKDKVPVVREYTIIGICCQKKAARPW